MSNLRFGRLFGVLNPVLAVDGGILSAAAAPAVAEDVLVFRDVRVFDGTKVIPSTTVVIRGDRIDQVGPSAPIPEGAKVIDGKGKTLLPGLIDCHTHTFMPDHLKQAAIFGVTTELDMFTDQAFAARMRSEEAAGKALDRADLRSAGTLVTAPGGHGTEYGLAIPTITAPERRKRSSTPGSPRAPITSRSSTTTARTSASPGPRSVGRSLAAVIRAAHARKKLAVVHILARETGPRCDRRGCRRSRAPVRRSARGRRSRPAGGREACVRDPDVDRAGERRRDRRRCLARR